MANIELTASVIGPAPSEADMKLISETYDPLQVGQVEAITCASRAAR